MATTIVDASGSQSVSIIASAAYTATPNVMELHNLGRAVGAVFVIDVTALTATGTLGVSVVGVDPFSGKTWTIIASASITATGTTVLKVHPGITTATNAAVADALPPIVQVIVTAGNAVSITYGVSAHLTH